MVTTVPHWRIKHLCHLASKCLRFFSRHVTLVFHERLCFLIASSSYVAWLLNCITTYIFYPSRLARRISPWISIMNKLLILIKEFDTNHFVSVLFSAPRGWPLSISRCFLFEDLLWDVLIVSSHHITHILLLSLLAHRWDWCLFFLSFFFFVLNIFHFIQIIYLAQVFSNASNLLSISLVVDFLLSHAHVI